MQEMQQCHETRFSTYYQYTMHIDDIFLFLVSDCALKSTGSKSRSAYKQLSTYTKQSERKPFFHFY